MLSSITRFLRDEEGATAIEYGIIAGLMAVVLVAAFSTTGGLGDELKTLFGKIATKLKSVTLT
ncbi:Flp/Fap pilin component [compost metagenome]